MTSLLKFTALAGVLMALLSAYPGACSDLLLMGLLLLPLWFPALVVGGVILLVLHARFAREEPAEPVLDPMVERVGGEKKSVSRWRWFLISPAVVALSFTLIVTGVPRRAAFLVSLPAFQRHVAKAPAARHEADTLGRLLGVYFVDRYAADPRGGVYFRTHAGADGIGPDTMSYGFAYRPNSTGTPFGEAGYTYSRIFGEWYVFSASDD